MPSVRGTPSAGIADTTGTLVSLGHLAPAIDVDSENMTVTVSGGTRYGTLAAELQRQGCALHNLASLPAHLGGRSRRDRDPRLGRPQRQPGHRRRVP